METNNGDMLRLVPKDIAHFNTQTKETGICHNTGCSQNCIGWIDNKFIFNGESFEQITKILERTFNVKINIHRESISLVTLLITKQSNRYLKSCHPMKNSHIR